MMISLSFTYCKHWLMYIQDNTHVSLRTWTITKFMWSADFCQKDEAMVRSLQF